MADKMIRSAGRGTDGAAKPILIADDGSVKVTTTRSIGHRGFVLRSTGNVVSQGEEVTILETTTPVLIERLVFSTNNIDGDIIIQKKVRDDFIGIGDVFGEGGDVMVFRPSYIASEGSSFFDINLFEQGNYKFTLSNEIRFPEGLRIILRNTMSADDIKMSVRAFGVEYGV